jgi:hypothetical protein
MKKQLLASQYKQPSPWARVPKHIYDTQQGIGLCARIHSKSNATDHQVWRMAPEEANRNPFRRRDAGAAFPTESVEPKFGTTWWWLCHAVSIPQRASPAGSCSTSKENSVIFETTTDQQLPTVSVGRARPDTGNGGQQCRLHQSVPLRQIPKRAVKSCPIAGFGRDLLRPASGSQTQSWACAATGHGSPVFSSLSAIALIGRRHGSPCAVEQWQSGGFRVKCDKPDLTLRAVARRSARASVKLLLT